MAPRHKASHYHTEYDFITLETTRVMGAVCQETGTKTKYLSLIIPPEVMEIRRRGKGDQNGTASTVRRV